MLTTLAEGFILSNKNIHYIIEKVIGQGSFGITYKAKGLTIIKGAFGEIEVAFPNPVAIKEFYMKEINYRNDDGSVQGMTKGGIADSYAQKFRNEAEKLALMKHSNIVHVLDFIETNNTYYYVMDFIDGEDLNHYIGNSSLTEIEAISIAIDVGNALSYMHDQHKMLHLDLKPGNIMRRKDGHIFLIDFGLSKHYSDDGTPDTSTTIGLGTEGYAPLEQGKRSASQNTFRPTIDVYALGGTIFKMLTGETPPIASDILEDDELLSEIMARHNISTNLQNIIISAMKPSAKKRTQTVADMIKQLKYDSIVNKQYNEDIENDVDIIAFENGVTSSKIYYEEKTILNEPNNYDTLSKEEFVDLGLSVKWRNRNLGANTLLEIGNQTIWSELSDSIISKWMKVNDCISGTELDIAQRELKKGWKMPTRTQFKELMDKCEWIWTNIQGVKGYRIIAKNGNNIFLPVTGKIIMNNSLNDNKGYYWSGTKSQEDKCAYYLHFDEYDFDLNYQPYYILCSIRPVHN